MQLVAADTPTERSDSTASGAAARIPAELTEPRLLDPEAQVVARKLRQKLTVRFEDVSLGDALKMLERMSEFPITFERTDLQEAVPAIEEAMKTRLTVEFRETPLNKLLTRILSRHRLRAILDYNDEQLIVIYGGCQFALQTRLYPVADLVARRADGRVVFLHEELSHLLQTLIEPETWIHTGGQGDIFFEPGTLTLCIRQEDSTHDQIEAFLQTLRDQRVRTAELLRAAGGPTLEEIRREEASVDRAKAELLRLEQQLQKLESVDKKNAPSGFGSGFFNVGEFDQNWGGGFVVRPTLQELPADARQIALRAMRLAIRFDEEIRDPERKQAKALPVRDSGEGESRDEVSASSGELRREADLP